MDLTLKTIIEFREEMREFRIETRKTLAEHSHRLNVIEATIASLKADVGVLLSSVPVMACVSLRYVVAYWSLMSRNLAALCSNILGRTDSLIGRATN